MVPPSRPSLRTPSGRLSRKLSPGPPDSHITSVSTRSSKIPLRPAHEPSLDISSHRHPTETAPLDALPRKATRGHPRPADLSADIAAHDALKSPTKVTLVQSQGQLLRSPNGVQGRLGLEEDGIASQASTPRPDSPNGVSTPANGASQAESRTLRSKDAASRLKSELSKFFPEYDDIMNDVPESPEFLKLDEPILITNEPFKQSFSAPTTHQSARNTVTTPPARNLPTPNAMDDPPSQNAKTIPVGLETARTPSSDPLPDDLYFKSHRRKENAEKRLRNREKENALHEKAQLERLLDELLGPDWLRVLGVTGITEGERKSFEWKRAYFVGEVKILLEKFRKWKEEEKRLKLEREEALARQEEEEDDDDDNDAEAATADDASSHPSSTDLDAWAARQLLQEATQQSPNAAHGKGKGKGKKARRPSRPPDSSSPRSSPHSPRGSTAKRQRRHTSAPAAAAAALVEVPDEEKLFFGVPMPELEQVEFALPRSWVSPEALRAHARKRRRLNRDALQERRERGELP